MNKEGLSMLAILTTVMLLFSGCLGGSSDDGTNAMTPTPSPTQGVTPTPTVPPPPVDTDRCKNNPEKKGCTEPDPEPTSTLLVLGDCQVVLANMQAESSKVSAALPSGYALTSNARLVSFGLDIFVCGVATLNNETVLGPATLAFSSITVTAPAEKASTEHPNLYAFEVFSDNEAVAQALTSAGFTVLEGVGTTNIAEVGGAVTGSASLTGSPQDYTFTPTTSLAPPAARTLAYRTHQEGTQWTALDSTLNADLDVVDAGVMQASGGVLADFMPGGAGSSPGMTVGFGTGTLSLSFPVNP